MSKIDTILGNANLLSEAIASLGMDESTRALKYLKHRDKELGYIEDYYPNLLFDFENLEFYMESSRCGCCDDEKHTVPHTVLRSDESCEAACKDLSETIARNKAKAEQQRIQMVERDKQEKEAKEKAEYERLKAKYAGA